MMAEFVNYSLNMSQIAKDAVYIICGYSTLTN